MERVKVGWAIKGAAANVIEAICDDQEGDASELLRALMPAERALLSIACRRAHDMCIAIASTER